MKVNVNYFIKLESCFEFNLFRNKFKVALLSNFILLFNAAFCVISPEMGLYKSSLSKLIDSQLEFFQVLYLDS